ncbi:uracil-DNA glycosylase family protein [Bartonella sp. LJL80]
MKSAFPCLIDKLKDDVSHCRICYDAPLYLPPLPHEPRPVVYLSANAKIAIAGQAPGLRVHETGIPFNDRSGDRLREWLGVSNEQFYDTSKFAIVPMGLCFPGYDKNKSDLPPRKECKTIWHDKIFATMPQIELVLAIGGYAQKYHIDDHRGTSVTATVQDWKNILNMKQSRGYNVLPLPHPSWRNTSWIRRNTWFENELLPKLKTLVRQFS